MFLQVGLIKVKSYWGWGSRGVQLSQQGKLGHSLAPGTSMIHPQATRPETEGHTEAGGGPCTGPQLQGAPTCLVLTAASCPQNCRAQASLQVLSAVLCPEALATPAVGQDFCPAHLLSSTGHLGVSFSSSFRKIASQESEAVRGPLASGLPGLGIEDGKGWHRSSQSAGTTLCR